MNQILHNLKIIDKDKNNYIQNLLKTPKKEPKSVMAHSYSSKQNAVEQADLLFLPEDNGYKYLLVIVDLATRHVDAEPLKSKDSSVVLKATKKIFKRKYVKQPLRLEIDAGSEFKGEFKKYYDKLLDIVVKIAGRHRQQSVVEAKNYQIGKILNARMLTEEANNGIESKNWVDILPEVIKQMNKYLSHKPEALNPSLPPRSDKFSDDLLEIGTKVRIQLDNPEDYMMTR